MDQQSSNIVRPDGVAADFLTFGLTLEPKAHFACHVA